MGSEAEEHIRQGAVAGADVHPVLVGLQGPGDRLHRAVPVELGPGIGRRTRSPFDLILQVGDERYSPRARSVARPGGPPFLDALCVPHGYDPP